MCLVERPTSSTARSDEGPPLDCFTFAEEFLAVGQFVDHLIGRVPPLLHGRAVLFPHIVELGLAQPVDQLTGPGQFCRGILRHMPVDWESAQTEELSYWKGTVTSVAGVLSEIEEVTRLVEFGTTFGSIGTVGAVVELGVGPLGIGWSAIGDADKAVGVDPLPRLIVSTGDRVVDDFARSLQERTDYLQADATKPIPLDPGVFDLVVCDNVIDHTQDPKAILVESARLAKPGGTLLFGVNVYSTLGLVKWRQVTRRLHADDFNVISIRSRSERTIYPGFSLQPDGESSIEVRHPFVSGSPAASTELVS